MAYTPSITQEFSPKLSPMKQTSVEDVSPKLSLPTKYSIEKEARADHSQEISFSSCIPPTNWQKIVAELVGTFFLVFVGCGAGLINTIQPITGVGIALVWGLVLMASIYAVGHISGAHFNPAVTLAFATGHKFPWKHVPMYILAQLLGSTLASLTLRVLYHKEVGNIRAAVTQYKDPITDLEALTWEFIITFILMFNICAVATDDRASKNIAGVAIGATVLFNAIIAGPITGASMNPARSLGPAFVSGEYEHVWVYIIAPILGAMFATLVYSILREHKPEKFVESTKTMQNEFYDP